MSEGNSSEGTILAWAKGWHTTCGKGAANKEVRVSRIALEGAQDRAQYAEQIGASSWSRGWRSELFLKDL